MIQTPWHWGDSQDSFAPHRIIAYDSEFVRERHYYPKLSLVQIAASDGEARFYDAANSATAPPWEALLNHASPLVMHAGRQDLEMMRLFGHKLPRSIRDTQIAFALLHPEPTISFSTLVQHYLGFAPDKSQTRSDWLQRPLTQAQLDYAANDVGLLLRIYPLLVADLQSAGRLSWWAEECARMLQDNMEPCPFYWYHLRLAPQLRGPAITIADILCQAREQVARTYDKPRRHILADKILVDIATAGIRDTEALAEWLPPEHLLWEALPFLEQAFNHFSTHTPAPLPRPPRLTMAQHQFCQRLQKAIRKAAAQLNIHPNLIINAKQLRLWCSGKNYDQGLLREGWRAQILGDTINALAP